MRRPIYIIFAVSIVIILTVFWFFVRHNGNMNDNNGTGMLSLSSPAFSEEQEIPTEYTCKGKNISPPLAISGMPANTKSLVLVLHDPDAPSGDFVHWTLWDISPSVASIAANSVPVGAVQGITDFGKNTYGGPCPPSGTHHYVFELYALDSYISLPPSTTRDQLIQAIIGHTLAHAQLKTAFSANN